MQHELKAPSPGESITEVTIGQWLKKDGEQVAMGEPVLEIESEKATLEIVAEQAGALKILKQEGETVAVGEVLGYVDDAAAGAAPSAPKAEAPAPEAAPAPVAAAASAGEVDESLSPAVRKLVAEKGVDVSQVQGTGRDGRITKGDVLAYLEKGAQAPAAPAPAQPAAAAQARPAREGERRERLTLMRRKIAERLVEAQQTAAILTTFNEVDLTAVMALRKQHKESFKQKHGVGLGFMSFFTKACTEALRKYPIVNAFIDLENREVVYHDYQDVGIAVGSDKGLVVPVVRNAGDLTLAGIEQEIARLAGKARDGKLTVQEMSGGTFTISNGGVYGSLLSTPILTPPQSAILGMHKIQERPMVVDGQIAVRPMMYLALSYDHRLLDGKDAVLFLVAIKEFLENPESMGVTF